jgi:predicted transposase YdaD
MNGANCRPTKHCDENCMTPGLQLMQLIVAEPEAAVSQAQALLLVRGGPAADPDWRRWLDLIETIVVYKLPHLSREEIQRMLHLPEVELKQTRFYQDVFAEGRTEGRTEGQQQEAAALVLRLLRRRLGALSTEVESRIRALPVAELEALGEALLDWHTSAELMAWLQRGRVG